MSRSGYSEELDQWDLIKWRGQVASAIRGKRGQQFLLDLLEALDAMPEKKLIRNELRDESGCVCALGALGAKRAVDIDSMDADDYDALAKSFGIAHQIAREVMFENDECNWQETPEVRWQRMRAWALSHVQPVPLDE